MHYSENNSQQLITKLTAIWAISESGLGGIFHALKLPFSGIFLGGFAVIIITFIAQNSHKKFSHISQATFIVILIKAIVSPHSPITAYIAVLFQGILGAFIYSFFNVKFLSALLFGIFALMESALQKLLVLTLIFGENIWEAFQKFFKGVSEQIHFSSIAHLPELIVGIYLLLYFLAGIFVGWFALKIPELIQKEAVTLKEINLEFSSSPEIKKKKKSKQKWIGLLFLLLFIVSVFILSGTSEKAMYTVFRTFAAISILYFVINPLFKYFLNKWKNKQQETKNSKFQEVLEFLPEFKNNAKIAETIADNEVSIFKKARKFLVVWLALSLYFEE